MNGLTGEVQVATGPAWRDGLELRNVGRGTSGAGSWYSAEELVWRESGDREAEALGWFSSPVRKVAWV